MSAWREWVPLSSYTTLKVGGAARYLTKVTTRVDLVAAIARAKRQQIPYVVIGGGSNILVSDSGYDGLVIVMDIQGIVYQKLSPDTVMVTAGAGVLFDSLVAETALKGYWGLENLAHIPGTVGATPVQNVGAYGVEVSELITRVEVYDTQMDEFRFLSCASCEFGYRTSRFKTDTSRRFVVVGVTFELSYKSLPRITYVDLARRFPDASMISQPHEIREVVISIRAEKFPDWHVVGTAGSFFKNPIVGHELIEPLLDEYPSLPCYPHTNTTVKCSLGFILDKICGLRGYTEGLVRLYEAQALVLVAERGSSATAIDAFAKKIATLVYEKTKIIIEREVQSLK